MRSTLLLVAAITGVVLFRPPPLFDRRTIDEPTVPIQEPVTHAQLDEICRSPSTQASPSEKTAKRGASDRKLRPLFRRFRSRNSRGLRRPPGDVAEDPKTGLFQRWGERRRQRRNPELQ